MAFFDCIPRALEVGGMRIVIILHPCPRDMGNVAALEPSIISPEGRMT